MELIKDRKMAELAHSLHLFDLDEILDVAIEQIPQIVHSHRVSIYLLDSTEQHFESKRHSSKRLQEHLEEKVAISSKHSLIPQVFIKKKSLLITNVAEYILKNNLPIKLSRRQRYTSGSCMLVPVMVRMKNQDKIIGAINFSEKADFTPFSKIDLEAATQIGQILGTAVHNCSVVEKKLGGQQKELMQELEQVKEAYKQKEINLDEAKKRQSQMQSEVPKIEGYDLNVLYSPMETIGGDFYDFIELNDHEVGIVVGDVSGHGIEAALVMSMAKQILSIYIKLHRSLVDTLCQANEEICTNLKGEAFVAVFLGILNTKNNTLRFVRAGQAYPLVYNPARNENPFELQSRGMVLGTVRGEMFRGRMEEKEFQLMEKDVVLIYSDGITEASDETGEELGVEGVSALVKSNIEKDTQQLNELLFEEATRYTSGEKQDDITVLTIKANELRIYEEENEGIVISEDFEQSEVFMVTTDYSFDEDASRQIFALEEKIRDLENQLLVTEEKNSELADRNNKLIRQIELQENDPEGLTKMLRDQLEIALELPKDLIQDNKQLNETIKNQQDELRKLEVEFNELSAHMDYVNSEKNSLEEESNLVENMVTFLADKIKNSREAIQEDIMNADLKLDRHTYEKIMDANYKGLLYHFENKFKKALEESDLTKVTVLQKQLFTVMDILHGHLDAIITVFDIEPVS
ncbi:SpoIIE family protein phosphatase [Candidatus Uabimicrobium sp. HlEnr_7]|uniref:SpoIIE family protein phosphatase n=1 Tax=Candidatus Uabimicrobium helgolandensis TaxID=3095367 RepID=UPI0035593418